MIEIAFPIAAWLLADANDVSHGCAPLVALILLVPAAAQRKTWALPLFVGVVAAWVLGVVAYGNDWGGWRGMWAWHGPDRLPLRSIASWLAPMAMGLIGHVATTRDALGRVTGVVTVVALVAAAADNVLWHIGRDEVVSFFRAVAAVGVARVVVALTRNMITDPEREPSLLWSAAAVGAAALALGVWLASGDLRGSTAALAVAWARGATTAGAVVVSLEAARRAGLSLRALGLAAFAFFPASLFAGLIAVRVFANFGGTLPAPVQATVDLGVWLSAHGGYGFIALASSAPLLLLAIAHGDRRAIGLHVARVVLSAIPLALVPWPFGRDADWYAHSREPWPALLALPLFALAVLPSSMPASLTSLRLLTRRALGSAP